MRRRLVNADDVGVTGVSEPSAAEAPADLAEGETAVPDVRRRARETGQEAEALKAQAEHQVRRARRNVAAALKGRRARVLVVDDSPAFLHAASSIVSAAASLRLVGVAAS